MELDFLDNYAAWQLPWWQQPKVLLTVFFAILVAFVVVYTMGMVIKKRFVVRCPYKLLLSALEKLRKDRSLTSHDRAVEISRLAREFVCRTAQIDCRSSTDIELILLLNQCQCTDLLRKSIIDLIDWCGWQKFSPSQNCNLGDGDLCVVNLIDQLRLCVADMSRKK